MIGIRATCGTGALVSQYYEVGGVTLWNPSNGASRLFLRQVAVFEEEVELFSRIGPMQADEAEVSPSFFEAFVGAILAWRGRTGHAVIQALSDGFIATCLVLADRAGVVPRWPELAADEAEGSHDLQVGTLAALGESWQTRVREQAAALAGFMPR